MLTVAIVDDDAELVEVLGAELEEAGYRVRSAADGKAGLSLVQAEKPALLILDVNMPSLDGLSVCRRLREAGSRLPIVMLTARDSELDEALGLDLGADDYVTKPFSTRVLIARVSALLRRESMRESPDAAEQPFRLGELEIRPERLEIVYKAVLVPTTLTEFRLIEALAKRAGRVLSRARILEIVRGDGSVVAERIVDTYVRRIRGKLMAIEADFDRIETVIGVGYRWRDE